MVVPAKVACGFSRSKNVKKGMKTMLIKHIKHSYEKFTLNIVGLDISENTIVGIVGENGAGKSTLMSILSGYKKANGKFDVEGVDFQKVLFVSTDIGLYEYLTVEEFIKFVIKYSNADVRAEDILKELDLEEKKDMVIESLSQGMKKKLTLVPMFVRNYELIILDEPFNSIDMNYIFKLKQTLKTIKKRSTILVSSHMLDTLSDLCDKIVLIEKGIVRKELSNTGNIKELEREIFG